MKPITTAIYWFTYVIFGPELVAGKKDMMPLEELNKLVEFFWLEHINWYVSYDEKLDRFLIYFFRISTTLQKCC